VCLRWPKVRGAIIGLAAFALIGAGVATGHQVKYWRNSRALYEHTLAVTADNSVILENLGIEMGVENDAAQSVQLLQDALKLSPDRGSIFYNLGKAYSMEHRLTDALAADEMAVQLRPGDPKSLNNLAWIYAASPQPELRNGAKAVALAEKACQLTQRQDPEILDTLAAALAETGRFTDAIQTTIEMQNLARAEHDDAIASLAESRLRAYRAGQALHEE
jgi:Flp pilus assembly protein TadD